MNFFFSSENQDVNLDAILGELCALESQLSCAQTELYRRPQDPPLGLAKDEHRDSGNDLAQAELDALASEISQSLAFRHSLPSDHNHDFMHGQFLTKHGSCSDIANDSGETDSAFSENASLPSSESFTSMVTVSSTAEAYNQSDACSMASNASTITPLSVQSTEVNKSNPPLPEYHNPTIQYLGVNTNSKPLIHTHPHPALGCSCTINYRNTVQNMSGLCSCRHTIISPHPYRFSPRR